MSSQKENYPFVKYYLGLSYMFDPSETRFIQHMLHIEFIKSCGYETDYSRTEYMKRMGLKEHVFERCVERLMEMNLLTKRNNSRKNRVYYSFNMILYEKLIRILSATQNVEALLKFCTLKFKKQKRTIESITEEEIFELSLSKSPKKKLIPLIDNPEASNKVNPKVEKTANNDLQHIYESLKKVTFDLENFLSSTT